MVTSGGRYCSLHCVLRTSDRASLLASHLSHSCTYCSSEGLHHAHSGWVTHHLLSACVFHCPCTSKGTAAMRIRHKHTQKHTHTDTHVHNTHCASHHLFAECMHCNVMSKNNAIHCANPGVLLVHMQSACQVHLVLSSRFRRVGLYLLVKHSSKDCLQLSLLHIYTVLSCQLFFYAGGGIM